MNNYRPVSLTCTVCRIFESIVRDNLLEHFKQGDMTQLYKYVTNKYDVNFKLKLDYQSTRMLEMSHDAREIDVN